jgi:CheY-like chemotaxis protein
MLETVAQAAMDGGASVHRLLVFARDRDSGTPERVELDPLLHDVATLTAPRWRDVAQAEGRPITVTVEAAFGAAVIGHPSALRQALTNLVLNAVDALPRGGAIHVSARIRGETVELAVADTGVGMTPESLARAFEPFYSTKGDRGTGLGLPQVLAIAERHGGRALLASTPGRGTAVTLVLPTAPPVAPRVNTESPASAANHGYVLRILAVEDEPRLAQALSIGLGLSGHSVAIASSGEEALEQLRGGQFDVLVTDLGLGTGMNGWELIERVRGTWSDLPIVLTTGWAGEIDPDEAKHRGVSAVVAKPYRIDGLVRTVEGQARRD